MNCRYQPTSRFFLYLMVIIILFLVCDGPKKYHIVKIENKIERIELKVDSLLKVIPYEEN